MTDILLVDDSPVDRSLFETLLNKAQDFTVRSCEDGLAALDAMQVKLPDIVVTDMQMPGMDGLELVQQVRRRFPRTPVILITGQGSEDLATQALRAGAGGYVPKSNSAELLTTTIRYVLELNKTSLIERRIREFTSTVQYELKLANDESLIPGTLQLIRQRITDIVDVDDGTLLQMEVAMGHAMKNAIYHGNLEFSQHAGVEFDQHRRIQHAKMLCERLPFRDRRVSVVMRVSKDEARFVVQDEGLGFDVREVSSLGLTQSLRGEFGQGLFLMWAFMDKVVFDKTGSCVTLIKQWRKPVVTAEAADADPEGQAAKQEPLMVLHHKLTGRSYPLFKERATVGRDRSCDIELNTGSVSHHHCLLILHEGWWFVRDLKSKNGVKVDGRKHDSHLLPPASILSVGSVELEVQYQPHKLGGVGITPPMNPF